MQGTKCHFIGIGGIGMSGLARIVLSKNGEVSGSDLASNHVTDGLIKNGAKVHLGHSEKHVSSQMTVIYSTDVKQDNPEYQAALQLKCPMYHRSDFLLKLMQPFKTLAVTGTHGKTTTSALLTATLVQGGLDPSYAVGGMLPQYQANSGHGQGEYFVAEADESDGTFLKYFPYGSIITNIDLDHMDHFGTEQKLIDAFKTFADKVSSPDHLFWCGEDSRLCALKLPGISYGFAAHCQLRASNLRQDQWHIYFDIDFQSTHYSQVKVALTGVHNALNALAVFGLALSLGVSEEAIRAAFASFQGVMRRCEKKSKMNGVLFLDDYAHHPTEIRTTVKAIRQAVQERRLVAIFQPHRYTRTQRCLGTFGGIFDEADELIITDIYGAREAPIPGVSHEQILAEVKTNSSLPCRYVPRKELAALLANELRPHDVLVTLGAGDITHLTSEVLSKWTFQAPAKLKVGVVFGGRSTEHEISLLSARHVCTSLSKEHYELTSFGITKQGKWLMGDTLFDQMDRLVSLNEKERVLNPMAPAILEKLSECDIVFPVLHGPFGEDGTIQGFFEMLGKAYVGCDCRSAALCMDKVLTKKLVHLANVAIVPFVDFSHEQWKENPQQLLTKIGKELRYPLFVKPVHLGSAIGVCKVENAKELQEAIERAFLLDVHLVVENGIIQGREIEFAVLGNERIRTFPPGEVLTGGTVYDYTAKYGANSSKTTPQAELPAEKIAEGIQLATTAYQAVGCKGMARVDFFLDREGKFWLNEINPIPGFTKISLYPQICAAQGLASAELMDQLIILGLQKKRNLDRVNAF